MNWPLSSSLDEKEKKAEKRKPFIHFSVVTLLPFLKTKICTSVESNTSLIFTWGWRPYKICYRQYSEMQGSITSPLLFFCCCQDLNGTSIFEACESKPSLLNLLSERHSFPLKNSGNRDQCFHGFSLHFLTWISPKSQIIQQLLMFPLRILGTQPMSKSIRHWWLFLLSFKQEPVLNLFLMLSNRNRSFNLHTKLSMNPL